MPCTSSWMAQLDDLGDRAVVAEVDDLGAGGLEMPAHDVDRRVVAVEERGRGDDADVVAGLVGRASGRHDRAAVTRGGGTDRAFRGRSFV